MSEYKIVKGRKGIRYMKDKKFISVKDVPEDILQSLTEDNVVGEAGVKPTPNSKPCIFCGKWGNKETFVNGKTIVRCTEHYQTETVGRCVQRLRELEGVPNA